MRTLLALCLLSLGACNNGIDGYSVQAEDSRCIANADESPNKKLGTGAPGAACTTEDDCAPICCSCPNNTKTWTAVYCDSGKCMTDTAACEFSKDNRPYCAD